MKAYLIFIILFLLRIGVWGQCTQNSDLNVWHESWHSCEASTSPFDPSISNHWVVYELDREYQVDSIHIWNYNLGDTEWAIKQLTIYASSDSINWDSIGTHIIDTTLLGESYNGEGFSYDTTWKARYIGIGIDSAHISSSDCVGLSEVYFHLVEDACEIIDPDIQISYNYCDQNYQVLVQNYDDYDHIITSGDTVLSGLFIAESGIHLLSYTTGGCQEFKVLDLPEVGESFSPFEVSQTIPEGFYFETDITTAGHVEESNQVYFIPSESSSLESHFSVVKGSSLTILKEDCDEEIILIPFSPEDFIADQIKHDLTDGLGLGQYYDVTYSSSGVNSAQSLLTGNLNNTKSEIRRFLQQSTFGPNELMIEELRSLGFEKWIDWQLEVPHTSYLDDLFFVERFNQENILYHTNFLRSWWHNTLIGEEYLRDRMTYALSQILVISSRSFLHNFGDGFTSYYNMLSERAFGNYRDILLDVTYHPMMGFYLSHLNNSKGDPTLNLFPDENYAREILQLFSIGLYELNIDGTRKLDNGDNTIPTYNNEDITEFAKIFTGLHINNEEFGESARVEPNRLERSKMTRVMELEESMHSVGTKELLNGHITQENNTAEEDILEAIDNIFNHPNVGPFLAQRLIQRLVKSNPSPGYISRVASAFNDNGSGIRGDLKAVVRAILLDEEARSCESRMDPEHGKLKEPILRITQLLKEFNISSSTNKFYSVGELPSVLLQQEVMGAPSVFNFYLPDYTPPGVLSDSSTLAPEFQIFNSSTSIGYINALDSIIFQDLPLDIHEGESFLDYTKEIAFANDHRGLVDHLNQKLASGQLSTTSQDVIINALDDYVGATTEEKVRLAVFLVAASPSYSILK